MVNSQCRILNQSCKSRSLLFATPSPFPRLSSILDEKAREMGLLPTLISKRIQGGNLVTWKTKGGVSGLSPITQTSHDQSQKLAPRTGVGFLCTSTCLSRAWLVFLHLLVPLAGLRTLINCLSKRTIIPNKMFLLLLRVTFFFNLDLPLLFSLLVSWFAIVFWFLLSVFLVL